jgi:hypothetical protein
MSRQQQTGVAHRRTEQRDTRIVRLEHYVLIQTAKQRRYFDTERNPSENAVWCSWNESLLASASASAAHAREMRHCRQDEGQGDNKLLLSAVQCRVRFDASKQ